MGPYNLLKADVGLAGEAIDTPVFQRFDQWSGKTGEQPASETAQFRASIRVGATQDLLSLNIDLAPVMQAGRWKTKRMPLRHGKHLLAARGGMVRGAEKQGRDLE